MTESVHGTLVRPPVWKIALSVVSFLIAVAAVTIGTVFLVEAHLAERRPARSVSRVQDPVGPPVDVAPGVTCRGFDWPLSGEPSCRVLLCTGHGPVVLWCSGTSR